MNLTFEFNIKEADAGTPDMKYILDNKEHFYECEIPDAEIMADLLLHYEQVAVLPKKTAVCKKELISALDRLFEDSELELTDDEIEWATEFYKDKAYKRLFGDWMKGGK